jgi:acetyl esterase
MTDSRIDPQIVAIIQEAEACGAPPIESLSPQEMRQFAIDRSIKWGGEPEPVASIENRKIPGPGGLIPIRIYTPDGAPDVKGPRPGLVYFHGGGWVVCDLDTHDVICRALARRSGAVVVSVDYRLAPEHRFPAAVVDCYAATKWVAEHAAELGIDPDRLAVGGDSAGGNLAAVVSLQSRDQGHPTIALQVLVYPVTDLSRFDTGSYQEFAEGYLLTLADMNWFRGHYLERPEDSQRPDASPLLARDLHGLPPALIITAELDPLRDEGEGYGRRLEDAGVPVRCTRYEGMTHPFFSLSGGVRQAHEAIAEFAAAVAACGVRRE